MSALTDAFAEMQAASEAQSAAQSAYNAAATPLAKLQAAVVMWQKSTVADTATVKWYNAKLDDMSANFGAKGDAFANARKALADFIVARGGKETDFPSIPQGVFLTKAQTTEFQGLYSAWTDAWGAWLPVYQANQDAAQARLFYGDQLVKDTAALTAAKSALASYKPPEPAPAPVVPVPIGPDVVPQDEMRFIGGAPEAQAARLYNAAFARAPDPEGLRFWTDAIGLGATVTKIAGDFILTTEGQAHFGAEANESFVAELYRNVLGRDGDASGVVYWSKSLDAGFSRGAALESFSESAENAAAFTAKIASGQVHVSL